MKITVRQLKQLIKEQVEEMKNDLEIEETETDLGPLSPRLSLKDLSNEIDREVRLIGSEYKKFGPEMELVETGHWSSTDRYGYTYDAVIKLAGENKFTVTLYGNGQGAGGQPAESKAELNKYYITHRDTYEYTPEEIASAAELISRKKYYDSSIHRGYHQDDRNARKGLSERRLITGKRK